MVRKIKVTDVQEERNEQEPQDQATPPATEPEPTTEAHDNTTTTTPLQTEAVALFEATIEPGAETATIEPPTPKPKRAPRKKKETPTPPPNEEPDPPAPEEERPAEEIKIPTPPPTPKAKARPKAKPRAKKLPTHDDEGQRIRPPASLERPVRPETPDEFWSNTLKTMKEKKDRQYATLIQAAF